MLTIIDCVTQKHNLWLVLAAAAICALSMATTLLAFERAGAVRGSGRVGWTAAAGAISGAGIWATHFVAELAYSPGLPIGYDLQGTLLSLVIGIAGVAAGLSLLGQGHRISGAVMAGLAVAGLHYAGMLAVRTAFQIHYDWAYVAGSIVACITLFLAAFQVYGRQRRRQAGAGVLMLLAVVALHFTGMTAVSLIPDLSSRMPPQVMSRPVLAAVVGGMVFVLLLASFFMIILEARSRRASLGALQLAFQGIPAAIALYDPHDRLVLWNEAFGALSSSLGAPPHRGMERRDQLRATLTHLQAAQDGGEGRIPYQDAVDRPDASWEGAMPDGRWLSVQRRRLKDGSLISVSSDITDQHRWADAMQDARDRAEAANRAKSEFLANMSHEIRTPLNGVLGMLQVMERGALEPAQRERMEVVRQSGWALLGLLNDLLDHAKIEQGQAELDLAPFDVAELAASVCATFSGAADLKGLTLDWRVDEGARGWRMGDAGKLRQILTNLVANAVKFTLEGGVELTAAEEACGLTFRVRDTGIGIDAADAERLFETFAQADSSTTRKFGGTGLGLAISRGLTELMGGTIRLESRLGEGACLIVTLPLARAEAPDAVAVVTAPAAVEADMHVEGPLSILVAEDNPVNQLVVRSLLESLDAEVTMVADGQAALEAFTAGRYDLVLMDVQMPEMNGMEATRAIRQWEAAQACARTPVIALTANIMAQQLAEYAAAGFDAHVAKPIEVGALYAVMEGVVTAAVSAAA